MTKVKEAETWPPPNKTQKMKHLDWAEKYLRTSFSMVLWTDEIRATLDGAGGWSPGWISYGDRAPLQVKMPERWRWDVLAQSVSG